VDVSALNEDQGKVRAREVEAKERHDGVGDLRDRAMDVPAPWLPRASQEAVAPGVDLELALWELRSRSVEGYALKLHDSIYAGHYGQPGIAFG